jgi:6-pyruvoyltetrahydropterin/6-carboxytetrahydropterin synthase
MKSEMTLNLSKENFKFSSAHFLIFDDHSAEMLHGHNYKVKIILTPQDQSLYQEQGYFIDFSEIKKSVKKLCDQWDEHVLLPQKHKDMKYVISENKKNYEIHFRDRFYSLPINETIWLPVVNTSVEEFSKLFAHNLSLDFKSNLLKSLEVTIEETSGQSATTKLVFSSNSFQ